MSIRTSGKKSQTMQSLIAAFQSGEKQVISNEDLNTDSPGKNISDEIEEVIQKANERLLLMSELPDFTGTLDEDPNYTQDGDVCSR